MWHLLDLLFPPRADEKIMRDLSVDDFLTLVAPRLVEETAPETVALLPFHQPLVRATLHEAKYHGSEHAFSLLAAALALYLEDADDLGTRAHLVPVPLGPARFTERGYNQSEEISRRALKTLTTIHPITLDPTLLERTRDTVSQVSLRGDERRRNMRGAFRVACPLDPRDTYIVVDDVITTGATLEAAADALKGAGATQVVTLALAH